METMKAIVLNEVKNLDALRLEQVARPVAGQGEAIVQIKAAALNHRDVWIVQGLYAKIKLPVILGSDGAGVVAEVGSPEHQQWVGKEVIINPSLNWGTNPAAQGEGYRILGMPDNGTQAEFIRVPVANLVPKPQYLSFEEAAAIPLAGLTGYRALFTRGNLQAGETVLITGIGGGVSALMLQMALAAGARVLVTSGNDAKIQQAVQLGATGGANYKNARWAEEIEQLGGKQGVDLIVDSAGGEGFTDLIEIANPGGRLVFFGATAGNPPSINLRRIFWKQLTLRGTTMGNELDFGRMVRLLEMHRIRPKIDRIFHFREYRAAYQRMMNAEQFGKIVLLPEA